jgi:hypothetical protein
MASISDLWQRMALPPLYTGHSANAPARKEHFTHTDFIASVYSVVSRGDGALTGDSRPRALEPTERALGMPVIRCEAGRAANNVEESGRNDRAKISLKQAVAYALDEPFSHGYDAL